jgi:DNA repair photolyase
MEPQTSSPDARLHAIRELSQAGIPTNVMTAPIIPGLNDSEIPAILTAAREAGAIWAGYVMLKLPTTVKPVFLDWLERNYPDKSERVQSHIRSVRGGRLSDSQFGRRQVGTGNMAEIIADTFRLWCNKLGYVADHPPLNADDFCPPAPSSGQLRLF